MSKTISKNSLLFTDGNLVHFLPDLDKFHSAKNIKLVHISLNSIKKLIDEKTKSVVSSHCPMVFISLPCNEKIKHRLLVFCFASDVELSTVNQFSEDLMYGYSHFLDKSKDYLSIQNYEPQEIVNGQPMKYYTSDENHEMSSESGVFDLFMMLNNVGMTLNYQKVIMNFEISPL